MYTWKSELNKDKPCSTLQDSPGLEYANKIRIPRGTYNAMFSKCDGPFKVTSYGVIQKTSSPLKILWEIIWGDVLNVMKLYY